MRKKKNSRDFFSLLYNTRVCFHVITPVENSAIHPRTHGGFHGVHLKKKKKLVQTHMLSSL